MKTKELISRHNKKPNLSHLDQKGYEVRRYQTFRGVIIAIFLVIIAFSILLEKPLYTGLRSIRWWIIGSGFVIASIVSIYHWLFFNAKWFFSDDTIAMKSRLSEVAIDFSDVTEAVDFNDVGNISVLIKSSQRKMLFDPFISEESKKAKEFFLQRLLDNGVEIQVAAPDRTDPRHPNRFSGLALCAAFFFLLMFSSKIFLATLAAGILCGLLRIFIVVHFPLTSDAIIGRLSYVFYKIAAVTTILIVLVQVYVVFTGNRYYEVSVILPFVILSSLHLVSRLLVLSVRKSLFRIWQKKH